MTSSTIRWLVDAENGGPPRAYECLLTMPGFTGNDYEDPEREVEKHWVCGKVTRTLSGMRVHQKIIHFFEPQSNLFREPVGEKARLTTSETGSEPISDR